METLIAPKVIDFSILLIRKEKDGILRVTIKKKDPFLPLPSPQKIMEEIRLLSEGKPVRFLVNIEHCEPITKEIRDYLAEQLPSLTKAMAIIAPTIYSKAIVDMFFTLKAQPYPHCVFRDPVAAEKWLGEKL